MRLLLDTCAFLWIAGDSGLVPERVRRRFEDAANEVFLSAVSVWELGIKTALGRLKVPDRLDRFVPEARRRLGIEPLHFGEDAALAACRLPDLHRDPFDRALVAQAIVHGLTLVTPDETIARYPARVFW